ncbi:Alpha/Beta hydrolase protein [Sphaerosporella brunnea]|uniref:Alpha/Beta hydrolase protein n=1 Tax=Sphaerosporella brunnea TaxID=1250544 RepID=A0A5J5F0B0_9PEZI|nr:Alpha/Beta hydrolase protein [Sphaerosporella brunnea]
MPFFNSSAPTLHHASKTVRLRTRSTDTPIQLSTFAAPLIPHFHANPLLFNGHLQTFWTAAKPHDPFVVHYARRHFTHPVDGGHFAVDFVVPEFPASQASGDLPERTRHMLPTEEEALGAEDNRPMLVALHGLSGGSHEVCVVNARGCAKSTITSKQLFNARWTSDVREVVKYLRRVFPNRPLYGIGFSLGANILTNYLGEEGAECELCAAVVCSNPWDLMINHKALMRSWLGREIYSKVMGTNMRALFEQHFEQLVKDDRIDVEAVRRGRHLHEFDRDLTAKVFGYQTVGEYYRDASSTDSLLKVRVPLLVLHARDDPIAVDEAVPYDEAAANPYVFMAVTDGGGHLSWFESDGGRWFAKPICNFLTAFESDVVGVLPAVDWSEPVIEGAAEGNGHFDASQSKKTI